MTQSSDLIIPSFSSEVVESLPVYYRALVKHLVNTGRAIIVDSLENVREV